MKIYILFVHIALDIINLYRDFIALINDNENVYVYKFINVLELIQLPYAVYYYMQFL